MSLIQRTALLVCLVPLAAGIALAAGDRITEQIDPARYVVLRGHLRPEAQPAGDQGPADPSLPIPWATLRSSQPFSATSVASLRIADILRLMEEGAKLADSRTLRYC